MDRFRRETSVSAQQPLTHLFIWPMEVMLRSQSNFASATQEAFATFGKLMHCRNANEAFAVQQQWFNSNLRRFSGTLDAFAGESTAVSHDVAATAQDGAKWSLETAPAETPRRAADMMQRETRRGKGGDASAPARNKRSGKPHKSRKRRAA